MTGTGEWSFRFDAGRREGYSRAMSKVAPAKAKSPNAEPSLRELGRKHPLYRAIRTGWWVLAIWVSAAVLIGVIRGTFFAG